MMVNPDPAPQKRREVDRGRRFVLLAAVLWSLAGVFIKFLDLHPLTIVFYRSFFASLVFVPFLKRTHPSLNVSILVSVTSYSAAITAFVAANKLTTAANAIVLQYSAPIFVFLYSRLILGQRITKPYALALAVSMTGVGIIALDSAGEPEMTGVLLALFSGVFFAIYMVNLQNMKETSPVYLTWLNNLVCAVLLLPVVKSKFSISLEQGWGLLTMGAVQLALPYYFFSKGLSTLALPEAALIALIEPVLNPLWVALVIGEIPSFATITGGSVILLGLSVRYLWPLLNESSDVADFKQ
jgi:drug/metabolite transporter (DMT)-like permease